MVIGIAAIVGIQSALTIISNRVSDSFGKMGVSSFSIERDSDNTPITYNQAVRFKKEYSETAFVSIYELVSSMAQVSNGIQRTDPVITLVAADENYLKYQMGELNEGRMLTGNDVELAEMVAVIGNNIRNRLFKDDFGIGKPLMIDGVRFNVVGSIKKQGSMLGMGLDNMVIIPYTSARLNNLSANDYSIAVIQKNDTESVVKERVLLDLESEELMKQIRRSSKTDFRIKTSDSVQETFYKVKRKLSAATLAIGIIALLGAAVSMMNIMLVSVKERRVEIGIKKALGASSMAIAKEFLIEALTIGLIGGVLGILLGILFGNLSAVIMESDVLIPWDWVSYAVVLSIIVSLLSGWLPARIAAKTDPIESLRDE